MVPVYDPASYSTLRHVSGFAAPSASGVESISPPFGFSLRLALANTMSRSDHVPVPSPGLKTRHVNPLALSTSAVTVGRVWQLGSVWGGLVCDKSNRSTLPGLETLGVPGLNPYDRTLITSKQVCLQD